MNKCTINDTLPQHISYQQSTLIYVCKLIWTHKHRYKPRANILITNNKYKRTYNGEKKRPDVTICHSLLVFLRTGNSPLDPLEQS